MASETIAVRCHVRFFSRAITKTGAACSPGDSTLPPRTHVSQRHFSANASAKGEVLISNNLRSDL